MADAIKWKNSNRLSDREFATDILADIGTAEAVGDLRTLSSDSDPDVAATAQAVLRGSGRPRIFPTVQGELMTPRMSAQPAKDTSRPAG